MKPSSNSLGDLRHKFCQSHQPNRDHSITSSAGCPNRPRVVERNHLNPGTVLSGLSRRQLDDLSSEKIDPMDYI